MAEIRCIWDDSVEDIAEHSTIGITVLGLSRSIGPCDIEEVGDISERGELGVGFLRIGDVALDVFDGVIGVPVGTGTSGHAVDLPGTTWCVGEREDFSKAVSHYASDADDQPHTLVACRSSILFEFFL